MPLRPSSQTGPNIIFCPYCHQPKNPGDIRCFHCGRRACPNGHLLRESQNFCNQCDWKDFKWKPPAKTFPHKTGSQFDADTFADEPAIETNCPNCSKKMEAGSRKCIFCGYIVDPTLPLRSQRKPVETQPQIPIEPFIAPKTVAPEVKKQTTGKTSQVESSMNMPSVPMDVASQRDFKTIKPDRSGPVFKPSQKSEEKDWNYANYGKGSGTFSWKPVLVGARIIGVLAVIGLLGFGLYQGIRWISTLPAQSAQSTAAKPPQQTAQPATQVVLTIQDVASNSITESTVVISWKTNVPSTSIVEYGTTSDMGTVADTGIAMSTDHTLSLQNLTAGTTYYYRVKSKDATGNEVPAGSVKNFNTVAPPDTTSPVISDIKMTDITDYSATISWITNEKVSNSTIEYGTTLNYDKTMTLEENMVTSHSKVIGGLDPATAYYFRIKSKDKAGNEGSSVDRSFTTIAAVNMGLDSGNRAPDFTLQTIDGKSFTLSQLRGKLVIINFWQVSCPSCIAEMPYFDDIYKTWTGALKLEVLAVDIGDHEINLQDFLKEHKYSFPVLWDKDWEVGEKYQIGQTPWTYFIDTNGVIFKKALGKFDKQEDIIEILKYMK